VCNQAIARIRSRPIPAPRKGDIVPDREGLGWQIARYRGGGLVVVNAHLAEIGAELRLHAGADAVIEWHTRAETATEHRRLGIHRIVKSDDSFSGRRMYANPAKVKPRLSLRISVELVEHLIAGFGLVSARKSARY